MRRELSVSEAAMQMARAAYIRCDSASGALRALTRLRVTAKYQFPGPGSRRKSGIGFRPYLAPRCPAEVGPRLWGS